MDSATLVVTALGVFIVLFMITAVLMQWERRMERADGGIANPENAEYIEPAHEDNPAEEGIDAPPAFLKPVSYHSPPKTPSRPSFYPVSGVINVSTSVVVRLVPSTPAFPAFFRLQMQVDNQPVLPTMDINSQALQVPAVQCTHTCGDKKTRVYSKKEVGQYACRPNDDGDQTKKMYTHPSDSSELTFHTCVDSKTTSAPARIVRMGDTNYTFGAYAYPFHVVSRHHSQEQCTSPLLTYPATVGLGDEAPFLNAVYSQKQQECFALYLAPPPGDAFLIFNPDKENINSSGLYVKAAWTADTASPHVRTVQLTSLIRRDQAAKTIEIQVLFRLSTTSRFAVTYDKTNQTLVDAFSLTSSAKVVYEFQIDGSPTRIHKELDATRVVAGETNMLGIGFLSGLITVVDDAEQTVSFAVTGS